MASPLFLGVLDEPIALPEADFTTSKCGGFADVHPSFQRTDFNLTCRLCNQSNTVKLILQIYCPLANSRYHRTLYIFACTNITCWDNSKAWKVFRLQSLAENVEQKESGAMFDLDDDWGDEDENENSYSLDETQITAMKADIESSDEENHMINLNNSPTTQIEEESSAMVDGVIAEDMTMLGLSSISDSENNQPSTSFSYFNSFYIACVEDETYLEGSSDSSSSSCDNVSRLLEEYHEGESDQFEEDFNSKCSLNSSKGEVYEKAVPLHGDIIFQHFVDTISSYPSQILRYCWDGSPLPMKPLGEKELDLPKCNQCRSKKVYELQILPTLVTMLNISSNTGDTGQKISNIDFGTVMVFSCLKSCWSDTEPKMIEETIVLQQEPGKEFQVPS